LWWDSYSDSRFLNSEFWFLDSEFWTIRSRYIASDSGWSTTAAR
jgi:hypothetical protein